MRRKIFFIAIALILLCILIPIVSANLTVGVKKGDWIEYSVTYSGTPSQDHAINWARIDVIGVQGVDIDIGITSRYANGTMEVFNSTLDLATGYLIDDFIIPADLHVGDSFLDYNQGNINISSTEQQTYAGTTRTVVSASTSQNTYVWDQKTGVSVEGTSHQTDYTMHTIVEDTNMWQPQIGFNMTFLTMITIAAVSVIIVALLIIVILFRRKKASR
jgi:hypothetical protein